MLIQITATVCHPEVHIHITPKSFVITNNIFVLWCSISCAVMRSYCSFLFWYQCRKLTEALLHWNAVIKVSQFQQPIDACDAVVFKMWFPEFLLCYSCPFFVLLEFYEWSVLPISWSIYTWCSHPEPVLYSARQTTSMTWKERCDQSEFRWTGSSQGTLY